LTQKEYLKLDKANVSRRLLRCRNSPLYARNGIIRFVMRRTAAWRWRGRRRRFTIVPAKAELDRSGRFAMRHTGA